MISNISHKFLALIYWLPCVYAFLGFSFGEVRLLSSEGRLLISEELWLPLGVAWLVLAVALVIYNSLRLRSVLAPERRKSSRAWPFPDSSEDFRSAGLVSFLLGLLLIFVSDIVDRPFGFYVSQTVRADVLILSLIVFLLLFIAARSVRPSFSLERLFSLPFLVFCQAVLTFSFLHIAEGRLLFSDDHPSFLYRLILLRDHFPFIPFYNPDWNAGYIAREFFPSGVLNVFALTFPFVYLSKNLSHPDGAYLYTQFIPYLFVVIVPLSIYWSARLFGARREAAVLAAVLALGPTTGFFEWLLKYGTVGFSLSAGLIPLTLGLAYRLGFGVEEVRWRHVVALLIVSFLCVTWTLSVFAFLPILVFALLRFRFVFSRDRLKKLVVFFVLFAAVNGPWMYTFVKASKVLSFVSQSNIPGTNVTNFSAAREKGRAVEQKKHETSISHELESLRELIAKVNPLLLIFVLPGLFFCKDKSIRNLLLVSILWLVLLATFGEGVKPQLELRRMLIPASFLGCILAGSAIIELLYRFALSYQAEVSALRFRQAVCYASAFAFLLGSVLVSPLNVGAVYYNRSDERFRFAAPEVQQLSDAMAEHGGKGRVFFLGFILQELGSSWYAAQDGGHIAALASFSGKDIYASDFYHRRWSSIDPVPASFRKKRTKGIEDFLDLVNASSVVTFRREWVEFCRASGRYTEVAKAGRFRLFKRASANPGYFLKGKGRVEILPNGLLLWPETAESVLKFRFVDGLQANVADSISPLFVFDEEIGGGKTARVDFISVKLSADFIASGKPLAIGFRPERLLSE